MEQYHVRIAKDYLVFSAGHFITFDGDACERLHGHNYRVAVEVAGPLDENHYVVNFTVLRDTLKKILDELDHHMLLPTGHPSIRVEADDREVRVSFADRRWVFPRGDCLCCPSRTRPPSCWAATSAGGSWTTSRPARASVRPWSASRSTSVSASLPSASFGRVDFSPPID